MGNLYQKQHQLGLTFIELCLVMALVAVLSTMALPMFNGLINNAKRDATLSDLANSLRLAQSTAIKSGETAFVCPSTNGTSCNAGSIWKSGWVVIKTDSNGVQTAIQTVSDVPNTVNLKVLDFTNGSRIEFTSFGSVREGNAPGTFVACDNRGSSFAKGIVITGAGVIRAAMDTNNNQVVENSAGVDISC